MMLTPGLPRGVKVIIGFHLFSLVIWFFGQSVAVVAYDMVAEWGLQDSRALVDPVIVEVNRAIGLTDTIVMLPLFIVAAVGLLHRRFYGAVASWLAFGMTLYWPVVFWTSQGFYAQAGIRHQPMSIVAIILPAVLLLIACWGSWYLYRNRELFH
jgi:hypothetical protein